MRIARTSGRQTVAMISLVMIGQWTPAYPASSQTPSVPARDHYADGVYTATGQYGGQPSFVTVTVTLKAGLVTAVQVKPHATVARSLELQQSFAAAVPQVVVGKPIDQIRVGKLAGSSGTPRGFNDAIRQIRQQAGR